MHRMNGWIALDWSCLLFLILNGNRLSQIVQGTLQNKHDQHKHSFPGSAETFLRPQLLVTDHLFSKEDRTATALLNQGASTLSYSHHINPHFRLPKHKK
jgi:hypothetical protein